MMNISKENKMQVFFNEFMTSEKQDEYFILDESDYVYKEDESEEEEILFSKVYTEYFQKYNIVKGTLKEQYGKAIVNDSFTNLNAFPLSESERVSTVLSLFVYKQYRFGVMLYMYKNKPLQLRLSACKLDLIPQSLPLKKVLEQFVEGFVAAKKKGSYKILKDSGLLFNETEEYENICNDFQEEYERIKENLETICGLPLMEDISPIECSDLAFSDEEQMADIITLFEYKSCRFGVLLYQEDKELPIELCITGYRLRNK